MTLSVAVQSMISHSNERELKEIIRECKDEIEYIRELERTKENQL